MSEESPEAAVEVNQSLDTAQETQQTSPIDENAARIAALEETINRQNEVLSRLAQGLSNPAVAAPAPVQKSPYENIRDDEFVEGIHLKNLCRQTAELQKKMDEMAEATVAAKHDDFYQIVNEENIAQLKKKHPTLFASLAAGDTTTKLTNAYLHIKNYIVGNQTNQKQTIKRQPIPQNRPSIADMDGANRSPNEYVPFDGELTPEQKEVIRRRLEGQKTLYRKKIANIG